MTPAPALIVDHLPRIVQEAEGLLSLAGWPDAPFGVRIVECTGEGLDGRSWGSGHRVASAHGLDGIAVMVACRKIVDRWLEEPAGLTGPEWAAAWSRKVVEVATVSVEQTSLHELAHALSHPLDAPLVDEHQAAEYRSAASAASAGYVAAVEAVHHGAAWAAAAAILYGRASLFRKELKGRWSFIVRREFERYGMSFDAVADAVAGISEDSPLRPLLSDKVFLSSVEAVIPPADERAALIEGKSATGVPSAGNVSSI